MKKKTKLFRHFTTILHICALSIPLFTLIGTFIFNYVAPIAYFASHKGNAEYRPQTIFTKDLQTGITYYVSSIRPIDNYTSNGVIGRRFYCDNVYNNDVFYGDIDSFTIYVTSSNVEFLGYNSSGTRIYDWYISTGNQVNLIHFNYLGYADFSQSYVYTFNEMKDIFYYTDYVDINDVGGLDDVENYPLKSFDDACFYTLVNVGALHPNHDYSNLSDYLYSIDDVRYVSLYELYHEDYYLNEYLNPIGVVNSDWLRLFGVNTAFSDDSNMGSWVFFLNWYINYLINISLIIFIPEVIMVFFKMCTNMIYKFVERSDD